MLESLTLFLLVCYIADLVIGDPARWPHPVRILGSCLNYIEPKVRNSGFNLKFCGFAVLAAGIVLALTAATLLISIPYLKILMSIYLGYASLALGCLIYEARKVQMLIASGRLEEARKALSQLVTRDTEQLDEQGLYQTLAETTSENYNDAFCAPFFYLSLLGVPWVWAYKMVSTMDSMWGYKTQKWKELGFAGAKLDDILAYIPARMAALSMLAAGYVLRWPGRVNITDVIKDAGKLDSPNAGWTMSAGAHLLGVKMGGTASYFGKDRDKPILGHGNEKYSSGKIDQLISLILVSSILYALVFTGLSVMIY